MNEESVSSRGASSLADARAAWSGENRHVVALQDDAYPGLLRQISDPPAFLYVHGSLEALQVPQVAVVGSRRCSVDGREAAAMLADGLARVGLGVCSGMATGIDTLAHRAALDAGGTTVAVLGTGVDVIYPAANRELARQIIEKGALVSELPLRASPRAGHFPRRNRIISGLSLGVVVVEAAVRSGSLITARLAMEQNREVFAVPGSIRNPLAKGCHRLIRDGVTLVDSPEQIIEQIGTLLEYQLQTLDTRKGEHPDKGTKSAPADREQRKVLDAIGYDPVPLDVIVARTGLAVENLHSVLLLLELDGRLRCQSGCYQRL